MSSCTTNSFDITVTGGSGGPYDLTWDNGAVGGTETGLMDGVPFPLDVGQEGGTFTFDISDAGVAPLACNVLEINEQLVPLLNAEIIPIYDPASFLCEGNVADVELILLQERIETEVFTWTGNMTNFFGPEGYCALIANGDVADYGVAEGANFSGPAPSCPIDEIVAARVTQVCFTINLGLAEPDDDIDDANMYLTVTGTGGSIQLFVGVNNPIAPWTDLEGGLIYDASGGGLAQLCFDQGAPSFDFDGDLTSLIDMTAADPFVFSMLAQDFGCTLAPTEGEAPTLEQVQLTFETDCVSYVEVPFSGITPTVTWDNMTNLTMGADNQSATFTSTGADAGTTYSYMVNGFYQTGPAQECPVSGLVSFEVGDAGDAPTITAGEYCLDDAPEVITPTPATALSNATNNRAGVTVVLYTDDFGEQTSYELFDRNGISMGAPITGLTPRTFYTVYDNRCFDANDMTVLGSITVTDTGADGLYDVSFPDADPSGFGFYIYYHGPDAIEKVARDIEPFGAGLPGPDYIGGGNLPILPEYTAATNESSTQIPFDGATVTFSLRDPSTYTYVNVGTWSGTGVTDNAPTGFSNTWFAGVGGMERIGTFPDGTGLFDPSLVGPDCENEITYTYAVNIGANAPSPCSCEIEATTITPVSDRAQVDNTSILSCGSDGTMVYALEVSGVAGVATDFEMSTDGGATFIPLAPVQVVAGACIDVDVKPVDCLNNDCTGTINLCPSLPVPAVTSLEGDFCEGGDELIVIATITSGTMEYSFDGGLTWQASNTASGLTSPVSVAVRAVDGDGDGNGIDNLCGGTTATFDAADCPEPEIPLPLNLVSFNINCIGNFKKEITWVTEAEVDIRDFIIERSFNGTSDWVQLNILPAKGIDGFKSTYTFIDEFSKADAYYRIRIMDTNGQFSFTDLIISNCRKDALNIPHLYPNPTNNSVTMIYESIDRNPISFKLVDVLGRTILEEQLNPEIGINMKKIDLANLAAGHYFVVLNDGINQLVEKLVKADN